MASISEVLAVCERLWPLASAEEWDRPGLIVGDPSVEATRVLFAVDFTADVLAEAHETRANLIIVHHPYLLRGVTSVAEDTAKGALLSEAIRAGVAVYSAHTNADIASDGVSQVFAEALGLERLEPLTQDGHGRVGDLKTTTTLEGLVNLLVEILPATARGVSASASKNLLVTRVALCGGAGDSFIEAARLSKADVYVTADLRHHVTQDAGIPLIDVSHWASESLWLARAAESIKKHVEIDTLISNINTDPWVFRSSK